MIKLLDRFIANPLGITDIESVQKPYMNCIRKLEREVDAEVFSPIKVLADVSLLSEDDIGSRKEMLSKLSTLTCNTLCLLSGGECANCGDSMLARVLEEWSKFPLHHSTNLADKQKTGGNPFEVALHLGASGLVKAMIHHEMCPLCCNCHPLNETAKYERLDEKCICFLAGDATTKVHRNPMDVIVSKPVETFKQWEDMTPDDRTNHLHSLAFQSMWAEAKYCGVWTTGSDIPVSGDTLLVWCLVYFGMYWHDLDKRDPRCWNISRGQFPTTDEVIYMREHMISEYFQRIIMRLCEWDPDTSLPEALRRLYDTSPHGYSGLIRDHFGKKTCNPSKLMTKNAIVMLDEHDVLLTMRAMTDSIRTHNQNLDKKDNIKHCMVPRRLESRSVQHYSEARKAGLVSRRPGVNGV